MTAAVPPLTSEISIMIEEVDADNSANGVSVEEDVGAWTAAAAMENLPAKAAGHHMSTGYTWPSAGHHPFPPPPPGLTLTPALDGADNGNVLCHCHGEGGYSSGGGGASRARQLYHYSLQRHPGAAGCPNCSRRASDGDSRRLARADRCTQCGQLLLSSGGSYFLICGQTFFFKYLCYGNRNVLRYSVLVTEDAGGG